MRAFQQIGPYRIDAQLGRGGMGEVYRAIDSRLNRMVAIKVMRSADAEQGATIARFLREARAASALNHPNIVTIYDIGETAQGEHFIVQELVAGRTLRELLQQPLALEAVVDIGVQVARALAAAHAAGIVHRDVKPENIMIRPDGYAKLLDFGLARMTESSAASTDEITTRPTEATKRGMMPGTTAYMSPEQAKAGTVGPDADVFALGIVLYEMATGTRPFAAATWVGVLAAIVSEQPISPARLNPNVPSALDALVQRMLEKAPHRRPSASDVEIALASMQTRAGVTPIPRAQRKTVGREMERDGLRRAYTRVLDGRSLLLAVSGEAGIGKTTLVEDFLAEVTATPERPIVTRGRCSERLAGVEAYLPVLEALENLVHGGAGVNNVMKTIAPTWYLQVAAIAGGSATQAEVRDHLALSQERIKREMGAFFQEISRSQPVVLVLEDLHWADTSTIDLLNYLAGRFDEMRLLVLVTYRQAEMALTEHPFLGISHELQSRRVFEELPLGFLGRSDVESYLASEFPGHVFPPDFAAMIYARTEGSPLFMADLLRYLRDSGGIVQDKGRWVVASSVSASSSELPASTRGMIARMIERLTEDDRRLLIAASVQGRAFDSATLADATGMDPAEVEERLDVLERVHGFVKRGAEQEFPDRILTLKYQFVHGLYQNVLYAALQPTKRTTLSARVAASLVAHHGQDVASVASRVAMLFESARDFAASAQYFSLAAQHAIGLFAFREALSLADRGLAALGGLPDGPLRMQQELGLQMLKGTALRSITGWATPELEETFARGRQLCRALGDPPQVFPVLWAIALFHLIRGNHLECRTRADELMAKATDSGNPAFLMAAHHMAGVCRDFLGDMVEASRLLEHARELHNPAEHPAYTTMFGSDPGMIARAMSSRPLFALGYQDRALERARETLGIAQSQRQPLTLAFAQVVLHGILAYRGDAAEALALGEQNIALCGEHGLPQEVEWSRSFQGSVLITLGRVTEGIDLLTDSLAVQERLKTHNARPMFLALLADGFREAGRIKEGLQTVDQGFTWAERTFEGGYVAELHRLRGELLRLAGDKPAAETSLRTALDLARTQQAKSFELRAATALARLLLASGRRADARTVLLPVYDWFTEGRATRDLTAARTTLSAIA